MTIRKTSVFKSVFFALLMMIIMAGTASAAVYYLVAGEATLSMPDGQDVTVWGYALDDNNDFSDINEGGYQYQVPGPALEVPFNHANLVVRLKNNLPERTSLNMVGQLMTNNNGPVWDNGATKTRTGGNYTARIQSFAHECPPGAVRAYRWDGIKPGSYLLTSGTNPAKQVQMGLYAPVVKDTGNNQVAYSRVYYDRSINVVFHEIDPVIHQAVAENDYGSGPGPEKKITSSIDRKPGYFLINGMAYPAGGLEPLNGATPLNVGDNILLRFFNAGGKTHVPQLLGKYMTLVAEDGVPYTYPKEQYGFELAAGKTTDALVTFDAQGWTPLYDATLKMSNAGSPEPGGMLAFLSAAEAFTGIGINFNDYNIVSYVENQDVNAVAVVEDGGNTLHISGNGWKAIEFPYTVTADTILEFDFKSDIGGEVHAIGLDENLLNDDAPRGFQLLGTETWGKGSQAYQDYAVGSAWKHYRIKVGDYFTGSMQYMTFINDHDSAPENGESLYQNVRVYDPVNPNEVVTIDRLVFRGDLDPTRMVVWADSTAADPTAITMTAYAHFGSRTEVLGEVMHHPDPDLPDFRQVFNPYDQAPDRVTVVSSDGGSDHSANVIVR